MMLKLVLLSLSLDAMAGEDAYCDKNDLRYLFVQVHTMDKQVKTLNTKVDETIADLNSTMNDTREQLKNITAYIDQSVDGGWSTWGLWSECSVSCSTELTTRNRSCSDPKPSNGGNHCLGDSTEYKLCNRSSCSVVNGGWSIWEQWEQCSATCGSGMNRRVRLCSNPKPSNGGNFCFGEPSEYRLCNTANCGVIHGGWSLWTSWTTCSSSCTKTRTRECTNPAPSQGGNMCQGDFEDKDNCNLQTCAHRLYVRLADGSLSSNGRVEVSLDNFNWGTVCDDNFEDIDARVVCRMLGYTGFWTKINNSETVDGSGPIYLDELACSGYESRLLYCQHMGWGNHNCDHTEDVGVSCRN